MGAEPCQRPRQVVRPVVGQQVDREGGLGRCVEQRRDGGRGAVQRPPRLLERRRRCRRQHEAGAPVDDAPAHGFDLCPERVGPWPVPGRPGGGAFAGAGDDVGRRFGSWVTAGVYVPGAAAGCGRARARRGEPAGRRRRGRRARAPRRGSIVRTAGVPARPIHGRRPFGRSASEPCPPGSGTPSPTCTRSQDHELVLVRGEGAWIEDDDGRRYLDATAGLWYCNVGHGRTEIADAAAAQLATLAAYSTFGSFATAPTLDLAERLAALAPMEDAVVFFGSGGSDGVDTAAKLARRYWDVLGHTGEADDRQPRARLPRDARLRDRAVRDPGDARGLRRPDRRRHDPGRRTTSTSWSTSSPAATRSPPSSASR